MATFRTSRGCDNQPRKCFKFRGISHVAALRVFLTKTLQELKEQINEYDKDFFNVTILELFQKQIFRICRLTLLIKLILILCLLLFLVPGWIELFLLNSPNVIQGNETDAEPIKNEDNNVFTHTEFDIPSNFEASPKHDLPTHFDISLTSRTSKTNLHNFLRFRLHWKEIILMNFLL